MSIPFTDSFFEHLCFTLSECGYGDDVTWSEGAQCPATADDFAAEAIFVICNGGMKHTVAKKIYAAVMALVEKDLSAGGGFRNVNKVRAIDRIWAAREGLFVEFKALKTDSERLEWCGRLPHIGKITKYHLAKNFGVDVAKPDVHLQRLADLHGETVQGLCERLAAGSGLKARTVDVVLWRACAVGVLNSRTGELL